MRKYYIKISKNLLNIQNNFYKKYNIKKKLKGVLKTPYFANIPFWDDERPSTVPISINIKAIKNSIHIAFIKNPRNELECS